MQVHFYTVLLLFCHSKYIFMAKLVAVMTHWKKKTLRFFDCLYFLFLTGPVMAAVLAIKKRQGKTVFKTYTRKKFQVLSET